MSRKRRGSGRTPTQGVRPPRPAARGGAGDRQAGPSAGLLLGIVGAVAALAVVFVVFGLGPFDRSGPDGASRSPVAVGCPTSQPDPLPAGEVRTVSIETELGRVELTVEADLSPIAAGNFVALADCGYYDSVVFHRVVPNFVIQGGDPTGTGTGGPGYTIQDEPVTTTYGRGVVAMARTPAPNSVGSQFFIVLSDEARGSLERANTYQIIGSVASGMEVVDAVAAAADAENPTDPVTMTQVTVSDPQAAEESP